MYQSDRGKYRKTDSIFSMFWGSCLGKIIVLGIIAGVLSLIAAITCPSEEYMRAEMTDNLRQCLENADSLEMDGIDNALANIGFIFTSSESETETESMRTFKRFNRMEYYDHGIYASMLIFNNYHYEGVRCGIGLFGIVFPTINYSDLVLHTGSVRKEYNYKPIHENVEDDLFGEQNDDDIIFKEDDY